MEKPRRKQEKPYADVFITGENTYDPSVDAKLAINLKGVAIAVLTCMQVASLVKATPDVWKSIQDKITLSRVDDCGPHDMPQEGAQICMTRRKEEKVVSFFVPSDKHYGPRWQQELLSEQRELTWNFVKHQLPLNSTVLEFDQRAQAWHVRVFLPNENEADWLRNVQKFAATEIPVKTVRKNSSEKRQVITKDVAPQHGESVRVRVDLSDKVAREKKQDKLQP